MDNGLTNAVRERRAQPIRFEVDGEEIEISPPTIAPTLTQIKDVESKLAAYYNLPITH